MDNKQKLEALASDLKRVTLGIQRNSFKMANRFSEEALKRKKEIDINRIPSYILVLLERMEESLNSTDEIKKAEDALMYSTLIQNYVLCR